MNASKLFIPADQIAAAIRRESRRLAAAVERIVPPTAHPTAATLPLCHSAGGAQHLARTANGAGR